MLRVPAHKCNFYDPDPDTKEMYCRKQATRICAMDDGVPGETGVLSCYRCDDHSDECDIRSSLDYKTWYMTVILGMRDQATEWDVG